MRKLLIILAVTAAASLVIGFLTALVLDTAPADWLLVQRSGQPPRLVGMLALAPIGVLSVAALGKWLFRRYVRWRARRAHGRG